MRTKDGEKTVESNPGWILLPEQMDILRKRPYMYNATAGSFLELLFLQRFWTWLVKLVPNKVAPCVLTCLGLAINLLCCFALLYYSSDLRSEAPSWTFVACAIGVFLYQTLDALDGKQAIKVQNTQIEEVYDHGCDATSTVFVSLTVCAACQLANYPMMMFSFFLASMLAFYTTHWQDHITHVMIFGKIDVSEAQFVMISIHLITAYFGQHIWRTELFYGVELCHLLWASTIVSLVKMILVNIGYVFGNRTPLDGITNIPRKMGPQIWNPVVPAIVLTLVSIRVFNVGLFELNPCISIIAFGLAFAKITIKLVMTNVTYADMDIWDSSLVAPLLLCVNTYVQVLPAYTALLCGLVYNLMDLARYFTYASWDMKEALDVWIFALKHQPGHPKCRNGNLGFYLNGLNNSEVKASASKVRTIIDQKIMLPLKLLHIKISNTE